MANGHEYSSFREWSETHTVPNSGFAGALTPENQEGGPWPVWYMESWNHMAHGPCIHVV